ncbi:antitoxin Xre/MbcA/ParS toxin-binding domain-containing protein [Sphingomonas sp. 28-62-11]|uniref:antitoxin Xre/MbcA/ParS toxin-binding domain-containing protein n=1 Tax=Sphingomonas sp. 28-62-11 TaxID=1970432 RepID=UPI0035A90996
MSARGIAPAPADLVEFRGMLERFEAVVLDWELKPCETAALLALPIHSFARLRRTGGASIDVETRMRRVVEVAGLLRALLGEIAECALWLRRPNPGLIGRRAPLAVILGVDTGLRQLRDALREEVAQAGADVAWTRT